jgi:glycerol-3-phosphate acyltransferase PlsX
MGGDNAPEEIIKGAKLAVAEYPIEIILVGDTVKLKKYKLPLSISIKHASEKIEMNEAPLSAVKAKKDASVNVAVSLVKNGGADAIISAGNTGALMAASLFGLGRISGVERPAIAAIFPTMAGDEVLLLDMGANVDCKPKHLVQFAEMGSIYAEYVMHKPNPRVALLNIGEEKEKGNELTTTTYPRIAEANLNFLGNIEAKDILTDKADVIVCDGFLGNNILKFGESLSHIVFALLKEELSKNPIALLGALLLSPAFRNIKQKIDYEDAGGAPLLGLNGVVIKAHGRARAKAIKNAIRVAYEAVKEKVTEKISLVEAKREENNGNAKD